MSIHEDLQVYSVTILRRHYFGIFQRMKKRNVINKGFRLLGYFKIPQFPYPIAEVRSDQNNFASQSDFLELSYSTFLKKYLSARVVFFIYFSQTFLANVCINLGGINIGMT